MAVFSQHAGFTILELMVAILIVAVLAGVLYPVISNFRAKAAISQTTALVNVVAAAITAYETREWSYQVQSGGTPQYDADGTPKLSINRIWDLNRDAIIDGLPGATAGVATRDCETPFDQAVIDSGYTGFLAMTGMTPEKIFINARRQVIDSWGHPLRIAWDKNAYGAGGFGVWSMGPDGKTTTAADKKDDITSWTMNQAK